MQWSLVKSWAKTNGYVSFREKIEGMDNRYDYYWSKDDDVNATGIASSVSKLAAAIYNHMTNDKYQEYQIKYQEKLIESDINHNDLSGQW